MILDYQTALPLDEAKRRVDRLADGLARQYGFSKTWAGNRLMMAGKISIVKLQAIATFVPGLVRVELSDPGALWRNKAKAAIDEQMRAYLNPSARV